MNKAIWKFEFDTQDLIKIEMPIGAEILSLQSQNQKPCLWALVDVDAMKETRHFEVFGTGQPIWFGNVNREYIGTYQLGGLFVGHLFECKV